MCLRFVSWLAALSALVPLGPLATAQAQPWITRQQDALWVGAFVDQPVSRRAALWFDGSWRRMDAGASPQQLLLRPGLQWTLIPGVRVAAGGAYIATAPYGALPAATATREVRTWQQLQLNHSAGRVGITQRYRLEQRWVAPLVPSEAGAGDRARGPATYQNRLRYMGRGQITLPRLRWRSRPLIAYAWDELLMPLGGPMQTLTVGQNRASAGVGIPLSATDRLEVGYLNLYNALAARRANEINHTVWVSWHHTGRGR